MAGTKLTVPALSWAAKDDSGHMAPFSFKRRETGPKDVTLAVKYCGICHTDLHKAKNDWGNSTYPLIPGHEIVGVVTEVGNEVTRFKVGDNAGVGTIVNSCRNCKSCKQDLENYCADMIVTYASTDADGTPTFGGFSNIVVCVEDFVYKMPANLPLEKTAPLLCAGITVYSPMKYYEMEKGGKNFGVMGLGGLGHMAAKIAKAMGMNVTVISTSPSKEKEARESLMADNFIASKDEAQMKAAAGTLDFIIDTVAAPHPLEPYLSLLGTGGKLILVGAPPTNMEFHPFSVIWGRKTIGGSLVGGRKETQDMLDFCGEHNVTCDIEIIPITYLNEAFVRLQNSDVHYRFVIDIANTLKAE